MSDIRLSDLYKSKGDDESREAKNKPPQAESQKDPDAVKLASLVKCAGTQSPQLDSHVLEQWYTDSSAAVRDLYAQTRPAVELPLGIIKATDVLVDWRKTYRKQLVEVSVAAYPRGVQYLYAHPVNVCVITALLGDSLKLEEREVREAAVAALLHDVGMSSCVDIVNQSRVLTRDEMATVRTHPERGVAMVSTMQPKAPAYLTQVIAEEHERSDGSGYPKGLKEERMHPYAQLIGLVDVYEALMHKRPYRSRLSPLETIKFIIEKKSAFSTSAVKALIETIGIFPVCQLVRLSTKEVARVVRENPRQPLRPVVDVLVDAYGNTLSAPKRLDLGESSLVYIEQCLESAPEEPENL